MSRIKRSLKALCMLMCIFGMVIFWSSCHSGKQIVVNGQAKAASDGAAHPDPMRMDKNGDGKISRAEASGRMKQYFDVIDTNQDDLIDRKELLSLRKRLRGKGDSEFAGQKGERRFGSTDTYEHRGDFSVVTLGTGCSIYNPERSGPCTLIHFKGHYFLVDMGNGTQARLFKAGIPIRDIGTFVFTHHHLDHNEEFMPLFIKAFIPRGGDLKICGPPRTKDLCEFAMKFYENDMAYRAWLVGRPSGGKKTVDVIELKGSADFVHNGVRIRTAEVVHSIYTLAYRFDANGKSIVISGDLSYSEGLIDLAKGADILVMDSGQVIKEKGQEWLPPFDTRKRNQADGREFPKPHGSLKDVATMAEKAGVKKLVLTHFTPGRVDRAATAKNIHEIYKGEILFGEDMMEVVP